MNSVIIERTIDEWIALLEEAGIPCAPINNIERILNDPQIAAREMIVEVEHPIAGHLKMPGVPVKLSDSPGSVRTHAPLLGHDVNEILCELLGWDESAVNEKLN